MAQTMVRGRDIFLLAGTRVALGVGAGLLVSGKLRKRTRERVGRSLVAIGVLTTIPLARRVRAGLRLGAGRQAVTAGPPGRYGPAATGMHSAF